MRVAIRNVFNKINNYKLQIDNCYITYKYEGYEHMFTYYDIELL